MQAIDSVEMTMMRNADGRCGDRAHTSLYWGIFPDMQWGDSSSVDDSAADDDEAYILQCIERQVEIQKQLYEAKQQQENVALSMPSSSSSPKTKALKDRLQRIQQRKHNRFAQAPSPPVAKSLPRLAPSRKDGGTSPRRPRKRTETASHATASTKSSSSCNSSQDQSTLSECSVGPSSPARGMAAATAASTYSSSPRIATLGLQGSAERNYVNLLFGDIDEEQQEVEALVTQPLFASPKIMTVMDGVATSKSCLSMPRFLQRSFHQPKQEDGVATKPSCLTSLFPSQAMRHSRLSS